MIKKALVFSILIVVAFSLTTTVLASGSQAPMANPIFTDASVMLVSDMYAVFDASLSQICPSISVTSCSLERKVSDVWVNMGAVPVPSHIAQNTSAFSASKTYSSYCTKGQTYRIKAVFSAGGESVTRYSLGVTYK